jgi:hypothetical protein
MSDVERAQQLLRDKGYGRLAEEFRDAAGAALQAARTMAGRMPKDITPAEEPVHVFRPKS